MKFFHFEIKWPPFKKEIYISFLIIFTFVFNHINAQSQLCANQCRSPKGNNITCFAKAQSCLSLICEEQAIFWTKNIDTTIATSPQDNRDPVNFNVSNVNINQNRYLSLTIKKINSTDSGFNKYQACDQDDKQIICNFNILSYDTDSFGSLTIGTETKDIDSNVPFELTIASFSESFNFTYIYETLPLNNLVKNNDYLPSKPCQLEARNKTWLECLISSSNITFEKFSSSNSFNLSYDFNYPEIYAQNVTIVKKVFPKVVNIYFPPKTEFENIEQSYSEINELISVELECKVASGNPQSYLFKWSNGTSVLQNSSDYKYMFNFTARSTEDLFWIICEVTNGVDPKEYLRESQTNFTIIHQSKVVTTKPPTQIVIESTSFSTTEITKRPLKQFTGWEIAGIVIGSVAAFLLLIFLIAVIVFCLRKSKNEDINKDNSTPRPTPPKNTVTTKNNTNFNIRQSQINDELTPNPVYGSVPYRNRQAQSTLNKPTTTTDARSDSSKVQTLV